MFNFTNRNRYVYPMEALTRVVDITSSPYNAEGVGGAGDNAIIQTAIADLSDPNAPQTLYFPQGTYLISDTMVIDGLDVWAHPGAIFKPNALNTQFVQIQDNASWDGGFFRCYDSDYDGVVFLIDGDNFDYGGYVNASYRPPRINNVEMFFNDALTGLGTGFYIKSLTSGKPLLYGRITNIRMNWAKYGIRMESNNNGYCNGYVFQNIVCNNFYYGIHLNHAGGLYGPGGNYFSNIHLQTGAEATIQTQWHIWNNSDGNQFSNVQCSDMHLMGNVFPTRGSLYFSGDDNFFQGMGHTNTTLNIGANNFIAGIPGSKHWNGCNFQGGEIKAIITPGAIGAVSQWTSDAITLKGAVAGDLILSGHPLANTKLHGQAYVTAADTVKVTVWNPTSGSVTPTSAAWNLRQIPRRKAVYSASWTPGTVNSGETIVSTTVGIPANWGDIFLATIDADLGGLFLGCGVAQKDKVTVFLQNMTAGNIQVNGGLAVTLRLFRIPKDRAVLTASSTLVYADNATGYHAATMEDVTVLDYALAGHWFNMNTLQTSGNSGNGAAYVAVANHTGSPFAGYTTPHAAVQEGGAASYTTGMTNPPHPAFIVCSFQAGWQGGDITLTGTDEEGQVVTEVIADVPGSNVYSKYMYKTLTQIDKEITAGATDNVSFYYCYPFSIAVFKPGDFIL